MYIFKLYYILISTQTLVLTYDLLEGRRIDHIIIGICCTLYFIKPSDPMLPCVWSVTDDVKMW